MLGVTDVTTDDPADDLLARTSDSLRDRDPPVEERSGRRRPGPSPKYTPRGSCIAVADAELSRSAEEVVGGVVGRDVGDAEHALS